ncbi:MAG: cupin domain-containing protein [Bacteroidia bacterium]|nr:cupin domain-containing protein [Bacteroidia bacterium]
MNAADYIRHLNLSEHVEGGAFAEDFRSNTKLPHAALPPGFGGDRALSTHIYFLLKHGQFSAFHRIAAEEHWHFYDGQTLCVYVIQHNGELSCIRLGRNLSAGEVLHAVIPAGAWFGSRCEVENGFSLVGCTVAPGFDFADFELANRENLTRQFPVHKKIIQELTH